EDWEMPPGRPLSSNEIEDIRKWILMGAPDPRVTKISNIKTSITRQDIIAAKKEFWSFRKPEQPEVPTSKNLEWAVTEIDQFVSAKLAENNLTPATDADAETFLRRLCVDLIGLPPNPEQLAWFSQQWNQDREQAIEYVVDKLLQNERYGERWARHWLDVARYAESSGKELNATFPQAWRYRDYVVDAFNKDKPYDEFIREQIAGDLLPAKSDAEWAEHLIATGFLALGPKTLSEQNPRQFVADLIDEQIDTTTRVVLGISVACARCHDHKFDPIPQTDYYAMSGIFLSTNTYYGTSSLTRNRRPSPLIELPLDDPEPNAKPLTKTELAEKKKKLDELQKELDTIQRNRRLAIRGQLYIDGKKVNANDPRISFGQIGRLSSQAADLDAQIKSVKSNGQPASYCMGVQPKSSPMNARLLVRGELNQPAQEVNRGFVQVLQDRPARISSRSSGRLEMAKWMTDEKNPLTARVMVNRIWLHLMGDGLVSTPENFGATGQSPTHPKLLDYLAIQFMESNWSIKTMIKGIVTSRTYRLSSAFNKTNFEIDPDNRYRWRSNQRRIDAEVIRDSMLYVSQTISYDRPRGSQVSQLSASRQTGRAGQPTWDESKTYRSIYLPVMRDNLPRVLAVFDFAEPTMVMGKRESSNTPSQALYMLNNQFVLEQSESLARVLMKESTDQATQVNRAFVVCYGRNATEAELTWAKKFLAEFDPPGNLRRSRQVAKLAAFCQALFASAEFRFLN
ncbi:MAG: DUF1549 and DUF1553 domain-containing protein, partial [Planctomycetota bacterium]|nr:DUF1549 and DUF1553 domain-containing protein [Planctomycetota bacterium]